MPWGSFGVGFLFAALATVTRVDADLWGHLRFGLDSIAERGLTAVDPYSFTQDKPWVNHEWLSEAMLGTAYLIGGVHGLIVLKTALLVAVFAIVWTALHGTSIGAKVGVIIGVVFGTIHMTSSARPQLWTLLAFAVLCRALSADRPAARRWLPLVFVFWVNSHGGWILGLGVLCAWAVGDVLTRTERWREWALVIGASMAATLVNPYGWNLWWFMAETVRMSRAIAEWQSLWGTPVLNWIPWGVAVAAIFWMIRRKPPARASLVLVLSMLAYSSAQVRRIESLFIVAAAILLAPVIREQWPSKATPLAVAISRYQAWLAGALALGVIAFGWRHEFRSLRCIGVWGTDIPDQRAMPSLKHAAPGNLVTYFDWGQYAIWHVGPQLRVSMDGRRETVYTDLRLADHDAILTGTPIGFQRLAEWRAEYVWLPSISQATRRWLDEHGYRIDVETDRSFVAVRDDLAPLPQAGSAETPVDSCFPG
jgi:hypothetical protein